MTNPSVSTTSMISSARVTSVLTIPPSQDLIIVVSFLNFKPIGRDSDETHHTVFFNLVINILDQRCVIVGDGSG